MTGIIPYNIKSAKSFVFLKSFKQYSSIMPALGLIFVSLIVFGSLRVQAAATKDGEIVERKSYVFPTYEQAVKDTDIKRYASQQEYETAVKDAGFEFEKLKYMSDGLKVVAYLYKPKKPDGKKYPTIIFNRGSAIRGDIAPELLPFFHRLASEGFVILAPLYRQSDGGEGRDEIGGQDVNDLMNTLPLAKSLDFIDASNLFMYGESRGGFMTYLAVKNDFPVKAAAVFGAITDMGAYLEANSQGPAQSRIAPEKIWADYGTRKEEILQLRSAMKWTEKLNAPLLIMHGGADPTVDPAQSLNLAQRLQKLGKVYELLIYAQDTHTLPNNKLDRDKRAVAWFRRFMQK